ncbi:hypothetical protein ABZ896_39360 [Streptomyces sp. NPDC047072]|uniref:hypothetical protein n=1 Tax=Streptomyces sp. NPDC047072 TaxID=3154809 RepID=UPI0033E5A9E0
MSRTQSVLLKVGVTGALGIGTFLTTNAFESSKVATLTLSLLISGSALIVQFMVDFEKETRKLAGRLERHADDVESGVTTSFARLGDIAKLLGRIDDDSARFAEVERLVRNIAALGSQRRGIHRALADAELTRVADLMGDLRGDYVDYEGEDRDWLLTLVRHVERSMDAASTHEDLDFWKTDLGQRYLMQQRAAHLRGVKIRRLIIVESPDAVDGELRSLRDRQQGLGIDVKVVARSELPHHLSIYPVHNFVVFDEAISYEVSPDLSTGRGPDGEPPTPMIAGTKLVLEPEKVAERTSRFEELWDEGN